METDRTVATLIEEVGSRIRQAWDDLEPGLLRTLTPAASRRLSSGRRAGVEMIPQGVSIIRKHPFLVADGRTPEDIEELQNTLTAMLALQSILVPLTDQVVDSVRQYQAELYRTVMNAYVAAQRVYGNPEVEKFAATMKSRLANGPRIRRVVKTRPVGGAGSTVNVPSVVET